jgi:hypothetical protein
VRAYGERLASRKARFRACRVHSLMRVRESLRPLAAIVGQSLRAHNPPQPSRRIPKRQKTRMPLLSHRIGKLRGPRMLCLSGPRRRPCLNHSPGLPSTKSLITVQADTRQSSRLAAATDLYNRWSLEGRPQDTQGCLRLHLRRQ